MTKRLFSLLISSLFFCMALCGHTSEQLIVVTTADWHTLQGTLQRFEKSTPDGEWIAVGNSFPVVLGKNGLAWGIGLHSPVENSLIKREGDNKSPAGIFTLGTAFGFAASDEMSHLQVSYLHLDANIEAVDDPQSRYYNTLVNIAEVDAIDWNSSEKMSSVSLYQLGMVIEHNYPNPLPGAGSAIFFHLWRGPNSGTAGCTAMSAENLITLITWLDADKHPLLIQLPEEQYASWQLAYELPSLSDDEG